MFNKFVKNENKTQAEHEQILLGVAKKFIGTAAKFEHFIKKFASKMNKLLDANSHRLF